MQPFVLRLSVIVAVLFCIATGVQAAKLTAADRNWIDTCISQRTAEGNKPAALRKYCTCMQEIVDDNEPFENATALERTYPPMHQLCYKQSGLRPPRTRD